MKNIIELSKSKDLEDNDIKLDKTKKLIGVDKFKEVDVLKIQSKNNPKRFLTIGEGYDSEKTNDKFYVNITSGTIQNPSKSDNATWWNYGDRNYNYQELKQVMKKFGIKVNDKYEDGGGLRNNDEVEMILSKDQDFDDVKNLLRNDSKANNLNFVYWSYRQPLGSIKGNLVTMFFDNTKNEVFDFIKRNEIKIANKTYFEYENGGFMNNVYERGGAVKGATFNYRNKDYYISKVEDGIIYTTDKRMFGLKTLQSNGVMFIKDRIKSNLPRGIRGQRREDMESDLSELKYELKGYQRDLRNLFQEMDYEAGQKGKDWSDADANRYGGEMNEVEEKIEKLQNQIKMKEEKLSYHNGGFMDSVYKRGGALKGNQSKIDMNKNGKLDTEDFKMLRNKMNLGGEHITFARKSKAIAKNFEGKQVEPKYQRTYGKRYDKKEAKEVGNKIAGKMKATYDKKAFGGLFGKKSIVSNNKVSDLDDKQVTLKNGEIVQVLDHSGDTLMVMNLNKLGSGAVPKRINISEVDMTSFMPGGKVEKKTTKTTKNKTDDKRGGAMQLAKKIRKPGESWHDALRRATAEIKKTNQKMVNGGHLDKPVKYVLWSLYSRDNKNIESCSFEFINKIEYHAQIANSMEQHHPKLFKLENNRYVRTQLGLDLGVLPPSDSYSLTCGLKNKIVDFLNFWKSEGYILVYDEPTMNKELFEEWIKNNNITKFTKNKLV